MLFDGYNLYRGDFLKNIALVVSDLDNPEIKKNLSSLCPKLSEKYSVTVVAYKGTAGEEYGDNLIILNTGEPKDSRMGRLFCELKRIFALRKLSKEENIRLIISLSEDTNLSVAYSFVPVKKSVYCPSFASLSKNGKKYGKLLKHADAVLTRTHALGSAFKEKYPQFAAKVKTVETPVDTDGIKALCAEPLPEEHTAFYGEHKVIAVCAPFTYEKGHWNILKAFSLLKSSLKNAGLVFIGTGGEIEESIKNMAAGSLYSKDILFAEDANPYKYIANADVYVQADISDGGQGYLLEAIATNTPVVSTDCMTAEILFEKYNPDFVCDKMTFADYGIITPTFDSKESYSYEATYSEHMDLANAMKEMILSERIPALLKQKALKSLERYGSDKIMKAYVEFVDKLYLCL